MDRRFDAIVIGGGQAGPFLAARLAGAGRTTALIERKHLGGTCVNDGCTPTKTLIASARVAHMARRAAEYGVGTGRISIDMAAIKARKDTVVLASRSGLDSWMGGVPNLTLLRGTGRFLSPHQVEVNGEVLEGKEIFLNTGCRAVIPDWPGLTEVPYLTNTSILELDSVPEHLLIVGGSYIGLEFAQMYRRFGAAVTLVARGERLAGQEDPDISAAIRTILEAEGIGVVTSASDFAVQAVGGGLALTVTVEGKAQRLRASHLLLAVGRVPNVEDLDLARAGIVREASGCIAVDERLRTSVPHIYALGDVNGRGAFTHTSYNDFEIVAANLLDGGDRKLSDRVPAYALYIDPPLGRAGMNEAQVRRRGRPALVATRPMTRVGRAFERGETQGFMKVFADAESHEILGVALLGIEGDEVVHCFIDAMAAKMSYDQIRQSMHIHPTVSELVPTLLGDFQPLSEA